MNRFFTLLACASVMELFAAQTFAAPETFDEKNRLQMDNAHPLSPDELSAFPPPITPQEEEESALSEIADFMSRSGESFVASVSNVGNVSTALSDTPQPPVARKQPAPPSATAAEYDVLKIYSAVQSSSFDVKPEPKPILKTAEIAPSPQPAAPAPTEDGRFDLKAAISPFIEPLLSK